MYELYVEWHVLLSLVVDSHTYACIKLRLAPETPVTRGPGYPKGQSVARQRHRQKLQGGWSAKVQLEGAWLVMVMRP